MTPSDLVARQRGAPFCHRPTVMTLTPAHDGADVSGRKLLLRQITREHDFAKFTNHFDD